MAVQNRFIINLTDRQGICIACAGLKKLLDEYKSTIYNIDCGIDYSTAYKEINAFFIAYNLVYQSTTLDENCIDIIKFNNKAKALYTKYCRQPSAYCREC